ncbi:MAG: hypothetical protein ABH832_01850, partial [bacterium]
MLLKYKKIVLSGLLGFFVIATLAGSVLFWIRPSKAFPVEITADLPNVTDKILDQVKQGLEVAVMNAAIEMLSYFTRKVAYDSAVWLAAGGKGESALIFQDGFDEYLSDTVDEAAGKAIEELGKPFGLNLCNIPDVNIDLAFRVGLQKKYNPVSKPACTFNKFKENWSADNFNSKYSGQALEDRFNASISADDSDLGLYLSATDKIDNLISQKNAAATLERQEGGGVKGIEKVISGDILTPAQVVQEETKKLGPSKQQESSEGKVGSIMGAGLFEVIPSTLSTFLNTFLGEMMNNFLTKGMLPFGIGYDDGSGYSSTVMSYGAAGTVGNRRSAEKIFGELLMPKPKAIDRYNIITQFNSCPSSPGQDNCIMDEQLVAAVQEERYGKPITIGEAMDKNWLKGKYKLVPPVNTTDNTDKTCYQRAYCYSNIVKMRKAGILPLGFEIAALNSNPDTPWTLEQVVKGFTDCNFAGDGITVIDDPVNKPFCHLIDPNWVLKAPLSRCNAMAYTNNLLSSAGPDRQEECVDMSSCVGFDSKGNCIAYGYCTRYQNTWRFDADKCSEQFDSCVSFKDSSNQNVSYLYRTLETYGCNEKNIGCSSYSLRQDSNGKWMEYSNSELEDLRKGYVDNLSVIHFNKNVSQSCTGSNSAGCSAFRINPLPSRGKNLFLYLTKAPDYLNCYDADNSKQGVQWPNVKADFVRLNPAKDCSNYASPCIPDEVNCDLYSEVNGSSVDIPGKYKPAEIKIDSQTSVAIKVWNDECDASCVGYDSYKEMDSNYSNGVDLAYIIPTTLASCSSKEDGCSSFTNLSTTTAGLEKVEYYTYVRPCIKPDKNKQKVFYTYEGSSQGGYQLKVYTLEQASDGSPQQFYRTLAEKQLLDQTCTVDLYKAGKAPADCRQFNDDQGKVFYKHRSRTIIVDNACVDFRLNDTELYRETTYDNNQAGCEAQNGQYKNNQCYLCFQQGKFDNGSCFYQGLPSGVLNNAGNSIACDSSVKSCRGYKGNNANTVRNVSLNSANATSLNFEDSSTTLALENWKDNLTFGQLAVSAEATYVGGHSLSYSTPSSRGSFAKNDLSMYPNWSYTISFWAKANTNRTVSVEMKNDANVILGNVTLTTDWNLYKLGPIALKGTTTSTQLIFSYGDPSNTGTTIYLDNLNIIEVIGQVYLVKEKLNVPMACDSVQTDNLPGEGLGCTAYKNLRNNTVYLTGFSNLCREGAIGCTALYDTFNTPEDPYPSVHNVWMDAKGASPIDLTLTLPGNFSAKCSVAKDAKGCYVDVSSYSYSGTDLIDDILKAGGALTTSSVYIAPDTPSSTPIYLIANKSATCNELDLGCVYAGKKQLTPSGATFTTGLIKNDPSSYSKSLCTNEEVGCNSYSSEQGNIYFKDPLITGQQVCKYLTDVSISGKKYSGWFWQGVGACVNTSTASASSNKICSIDKDCNTGETCQNKDKQPCYPDYLQANNMYGLWSYGNKDKYKGFVGSCPADQNGCTGFRDPNDNDKTYYLLNNTKITTAKAACTEGASLEKGCVLFDQTSITAMNWNAKLTYDLSAKNKYDYVKPVSSSTINNTNIVMKVVRDRECGEWIQCSKSQRYWNSIESKFKETCDVVGRCNKVDPSVDKSDMTNCGNWIENNHAYANKTLEATDYRSRPVDWASMDFSGYSILGMYPLEELEQINLGNSKIPDWRLVKVIKDPNDKCELKNTLDATLCGNYNEGICYNKICLQTPFGTKKDVSDITNLSPAHECRAYPEKNAPFPNTEATQKSQSYANANFCSENPLPSSIRSIYNACECDYAKVQYGDNATTYWNYYNPNSSGDLVWYNSIFGLDMNAPKGVPIGVCYGTKGLIYDGNYCTMDADCKKLSSSDPGQCLFARQEDKFVGWRGFCLEHDTSRSLNAQQRLNPCLTWYPVDNITGAIDITSNPEAGYQVKQYGAYYCANAVGNYRFYSDDYEKVYKLLVQELKDIDAHCYSHSAYSYPVYCNGYQSGGYCHHDESKYLYKCYDVKIETIEKYQKIFGGLKGNNKISGDEDGTQFPLVSASISPPPPTPPYFYDFPYLVTLTPKATQDNDSKYMRPKNKSFFYLEGLYWSEDAYVNYYLADKVNNQRPTNTGGLQVGHAKTTQPFMDQYFHQYSPKNGSNYIKLEYDPYRTSYLPANSNPLDSNHPIYLDDIDMVRIRVGSCVKPDITSANSGQKCVDEDYTVQAGDYYIRNSRLVNNNYEDVITWYGAGYGDKNYNNNKPGCVVVTGREFLNSNTGKNERIQVEPCLQESTNGVFGGEKWLIANNGDTYGANNDPVGPMIAESRIIRNTGLKGNETVMRFMFDNKRYVSLSGTAEYPVRYIENRNGFFNQYGDNLRTKSKDGVDDKSTDEMCDNGDESGQDSLEVMIVFDSLGKLTKILVAYCSAGTGNDDEPSLQNIHIDAILKENCNLIADVASNNMNVAYTDNLWKTGIKAFTYDKTTPAIPFGSLDITENPTSKKYTLDDMGLFIQDSPFVSPKYNRKPTRIGAPYGCEKDCGGILAYNETKLNFEQKSEVNKDGYQLGRENIGANLFAKSNSMFYYNRSLSSFTEIKSIGDLKVNQQGNSNFNYTEGPNSTQPIYWTAPRVRSVDINNCSSVGTCLEGKDDTITINNQSGGDIVLTKYPAKATMKFYMLADKNHMPIKKVTVDWGDNSGKVIKGDGITSSYRNHRGLTDAVCKKPQIATDKVCFVKSDDWSVSQGAYETKMTTQKCNSDADCKLLDICKMESKALNWGEIIDRACNASYIQFTGTYNCKADSKNKYYHSDSMDCGLDTATQSEFPDG